jgi:hypothetical protein
MNSVQHFLTAQQQAEPEHRFSYFLPPVTNTRPAKTIELAELWDEITSEQHRPLTERLRAASSDNERKKLKAGLPFITPAGCFNYPRRDADLIADSGLLVLDFDKVPSVREARAVLPADEILGKDVMLMFTSPTGNGIKVFLRTDPNETHLDNFRAYVDYLSGKYRAFGLVADESGKNPARLCFIPYDPTAYLHLSYRSAWITQ